MSTHNITVKGGTSVRLPTAGKYCDRDIIVTAEGTDAPIYDGTPIEVYPDSAENTDTDFVFTGEADQQMVIEDIVKIKVKRSEFGDATASDVRAGKTFTSADGVKDTGTYEDDGGSGSGSSLNTCTVILDVGTFSAFTPNGVRVFFTAYGDGLSAEFREVDPNEQSEIYLYNVVCGSAICIYTDVAGASDATGVRYTDEYTHYIIAPSVAGATELITFTETT